MSFYNHTWENSHTLSCFISSSDCFANNSTRGANYLQKYNFLEGDLIKTPEIIYRDNPQLKKFKNKKILVLGGGPTTNWYDWNPDEYDHIFSCNHFFLNEKLSKCKVDLAIICGEVDVNRRDFLEYVIKNDTLLGFEDYWPNPDNVKILNNFIKKEISSNNVFDCILRFQGKIGVAPKLVNLAILLGAREVHFAGVDGHSKNYKKGDSEDHAFQKGKKITTGYAYELIEKHYECFKKYIQTEIGKNVIIKNLGEGHEQNVYSKIPDFKIE
tara:strand:+ start:456 stop:1265 length:810 start_codon:yes stop_codon:yes gene_type:complete